MPPDRYYSAAPEPTCSTRFSSSEATITLTHEKCAPLTLYVLVPGENVANILLDRQSVNLTTGDGPFTLSADITNAAEDDYKNLEWTIEQDEQNPVLKKAGSGKAVSLTPLAEGTATVVATVPSSLRSAKCAVTITKPRSISFNYEKLKEACPNGGQRERPESEHLDGGGSLS